MTRNADLERTTFSIDEIPTGERGAYLLNLPPERLQWALFDAVNREMPDATHGKTGNDLLFHLMMAIGSFGHIAACTSLEDARQNAREDIAMLVPVVVRWLNESSQKGGVR
ncbi:MAG: hypothetical protein KDB01_05365 [Planctomycetaceae bacterium]|nr:hypothetical protein [Planctomycetaceae bacterium]